MLIDYAVEQDAINPADFFVESWWLTRDGERLFPGETAAPGPSAEPTPGPSAEPTPAPSAEPTPAPGGDDNPGRNPGLNVDTAAGDTAHGSAALGGAALFGLAAALALTGIFVVGSRRGAWRRRG